MLAGAGTGKTRVLVHRITRLVDSGTPPWRVLAVTFTNKAAGEMRSRLRDMLGAGADRMWIGTFHSMCARLLRIYSDRVGLSRNFVIFDDDDQMRVLNALLKAQGLDQTMGPRAVANLIDRAKNRGEDPIQTAPHAVAEEVLTAIYPLYQKRLASEDAVDFNDLLLRVLTLVEDSDIGPELAARFDHILVDEFQDTNLVQYRLVRQFARETKNLTVVGDDDQSIYSWRGAAPRNLLNFDRDFPQATVIKLEQNYRSTDVILGAANALIARNTQRRGKQLWTDRQGGDPILWEEADTEREEAEFVARAISGLVEHEGRNWGETAILYRTHAQSRVLEEQLRRYRIDYRIVGGLSFFQRREVKDIRAYLRLVTNTAADSCFERIVNVPTRGIGKTTVDRVKAHAHVANLTLFDAARSCSHGAVQSIGSAARKKLAAFVEIIDALRQVASEGASVAELVIQAVERTGYRARLEIEDSLESRDRLNNLAELVTMASDFDEETGGDGKLVEFDERISLASANDAGDGRGEAVTMMTIHAAKGLEFPIVFICGLEDGLFPSLREREHELEDQDSLEEERRLAYVAITRAEDRLILTNARTRRHWGEIRSQRPSRFLSEIPEAFLAVRARPKRPPSTPLPWATRKPAPSYNEFDQRSHYDEMPVYDADGDGLFGPGACVRHRSFGEGRVVEMRGGQGQNQKLVIEFPSVGRKTIVAKFVESIEL